MQNSEGKYNIRLERVETNYYYTMQGATWETYVLLLFNARFNRFSHTLQSACTIQFLFSEFFFKTSQRLPIFATSFSSSLPGTEMI